LAGNRNTDCLPHAFQCIRDLLPDLSHPPVRGTRTHASSGCGLDEVARQHFIYFVVPTGPGGHRDPVLAPSHLICLRVWTCRSPRAAIAPAYIGINSADPATTALSPPGSKPRAS